MAIKWKIDPAHSEIQFKVKHLMITTVTGYFRTFDCEVISETEDFNSTTSIKFTAGIDSIETNNEQRFTPHAKAFFKKLKPFTAISSCDGSNFLHIDAAFAITFTSVVKDSITAIPS